MSFCYRSSGRSLPHCPLVLILTLNIHVHLKIFHFICPFVTDHPADHCHIVLQLKILMLSASVSFILYRACCYIHLNQVTQLILPECFSFSLPHLIFSSMHLSFFSVILAISSLHISALLLFVSAFHIKLQQWVFLHVS